VGLVAFDKKGHPVTDLKPTEFELYDNGRKQEVRYFSQAGGSEAEQAGAPAAPAGPSTDQPEYSNRRPEQAKSTKESSETVLLIDSSNLAFVDLSYAREQMLEFLKKVPADENVGLYILKRSGFQILDEPTADHAEIANKLAHWMPSAGELSNAQDEESRNRQQMETVHSLEDLASVNGNEQLDPQTQTRSPDPKLRDYGSNPGRDALTIFVGIARHLAAFNGHKNLVWVASDNVLVDWTNQSVSIEATSKNIEPFSLRAQEAMNESHISVYPLDASHLEASVVDASVGRRNVELNPTVTMPQAQIPGGGEGLKSGPDIDLVDGERRDMRSTRLTAEMKQDLRPIRGEVRDLAQATGGRVFRRSSNIVAELDGVVADGRAAYLLSFSPDAPADDKYHVLTVKLVGRRDITLHYRAGYLASKEPATFKDRFRQAIWQPADANQIAVGATPVKGTSGGAIKLNIAATDLSLAQQGQLWMDKLDIFLVLRDDAALHADVSGQTLGLRLKPATYQQVLRDGIPFEQSIEKKLEGGSIRVVVVDENSGRIGSVTLPAAAFTN